MESNENKSKSDGRSLRVKRPRQSIAMTKRWATASYKKRISAAQKKSYEDNPERKEKVVKHLKSDRMRKIVSESMKANWKKKKQLESGHLASKAGDGSSGTTD